MAQKRRKAPGSGAFSVRSGVRSPFQLHNRLLHQKTRFMLLQGAARRFVFIDALFGL